MEFWAEGGLVELPNSGAAFIHATERHNYRTGCPEDDCHSSIRRHPIRVSSLAPDHLVTTTWEDFVNGVDPSLTKALELVSTVSVRER